MIQYNNLNVKLSNLQLNKLKPGIKNGTELTINISSNLVRNLNNENNFLHKLLLTDTHKFQGLVKFLQMVHQLM